MKKLRFFFALTLILCALLCGCSEKISFPYADIETPIESIELLRHPWYADSTSGEMGDFVLIRYLDGEEIRGFMDGIYSLGVQKASFGEPPVGYGEYLARVNYSDGRELYLGALS